MVQKIISNIFLLTDAVFVMFSWNNLSSRDTWSINSPVIKLCAQAL